MQENELRLSDLFVLILRKWRAIVGFGIVVALILGIGSVAFRLISLNMPEQRERMQAEYEAAYGVYWGAIDTVDRQIRNNENYMEQAKIELEDLDRQKENYEFAIEDLEADIEYYSLQIVDLEKNIEVLETEKENAQYRLNYRNEQNENSLFMSVDPYDVKTSEIFIRVDSGYQIIPGSTYQDTDPTGELLQTYRLLVTNAEFYETMISDLNMNTEVRYLTEVVSVKEYGTNSLRIQTIGFDADVVREVVEYICDAILKNQDTVMQTVSEHTLEVYSKRNYSVVDMDIYDEQQNFLMASVELESEIRELDADILNTQASIRHIRADVREFEDDIENVKYAIANLPVVEENLNSAIAGYQDSINQLRIQRLNLLREDPPKAPGMTLLGGLIRFVKFAVIGGVAAVVVAAVWFVLVAVMRGKVLSAKQISSNFGFSFFGSWSAETGKKRKFAFVDRWVDRATGGGKGDEALVCANVAAAISGYSRILVCGGADEQRIAAVAAGLKSKCSGVDVIPAGSYVNDPKAVEGLACCDAVVLVETAYRSDLDTIHQTKERAQTMNKPILGVVLA